MCRSKAMVFAQWYPLREAPFRCDPLCGWHLWMMQLGQIKILIVLPIFIHIVGVIQNPLLIDRPGFFLNHKIWAEFFKVFPL